MEDFETTITVRGSIRGQLAAIDNGVRSVKVDVVSKILSLAINTVQDDDLFIEDILEYQVDSRTDSWSEIMRVNAEVVLGTKFTTEVEMLESHSEYTVNFSVRSTETVDGGRSYKTIKVDASFDK